MGQSDKANTIKTAFTNKMETENNKQKKPKLKSNEIDIVPCFSVEQSQRGFLFFQLLYFVVPFLCLSFKLSHFSFQGENSNIGNNPHIADLILFGRDRWLTSATQHSSTY